MVKANKCDLPPDRVRAVLYISNYMIKKYGLDEALSRIMKRKKYKYYFPTK